MTRPNELSAISSQKKRNVGTESATNTPAIEARKTAWHIGIQWKFHRFSRCSRYPSANTDAERPTPPSIVRKRPEIRSRATVTGPRTARPSQATRHSCPARPRLPRTSTRPEPTEAAWQPILRHRTAMS